MEYFGKSISSIYRLYQSYLRKSLKKFDLGSGTYPLLLTINEFEGISQNELARCVELDKAMVARNVKKLVKLGYVKKKCSSADCKKQIIYLSPKGKEILPEINQILIEWEESVLSDLDEGHVKFEIKKVLETSKMLLER